MILEHNPYIKSPEELDIDFKEELSTKPDISEDFKNEVRYAPDKYQHISQNERILTDEDENTGTGFNSKTEVLTYRINMKARKNNQ